MDTATLYSNEYITLKYNAENGLIHHTIHQPIGDNGQMMKDALNLGTAAMKEHHLCKWLSDDRKNGPLSQDLINWASTDWNPRTIKIGWKYWANVVPQELISAATLTPVIHDLSTHGLRMRLFSTVEDALAWLRSVDNQ